MLIFYQLSFILLFTIKCRPLHIISYKSIPISRALFSLNSFDQVVIKMKSSMQLISTLFFLVILVVAPGIQILNKSTKLYVINLYFISLV